MTETLKLRGKNLETSNINITNFQRRKYNEEQIQAKDRIKRNDQIKCPLPETIFTEWHENQRKHCRRKDQLM